MSELPEGWAEVLLGDAVRFNYGKGLPDRERSGSGFPVYGSNGIVGRHSVALVRRECLVVGRKGSVGEVHYSDGPCWPIDTTYFVDEFCGMPLRYWYHALRWLGLESLDRATAIPGLNREDAYAQAVPLPPLPEQKRIADKLDALLARVDACRERLDRVPGILKRFRQSVLAAATSGELTREWRGGTDADWPSERAEDVCEKVQSGGTPKSGFASQGIPFLKVYNIVDQRVDFRYRPQFVAPEVHRTELRKSEARPGDVLMNIVGPPLGKVAVVPNEFATWNLNQAITLFRPSDRISSDWLYYVLCSGRSIAEIQHQTRGSAGQVNISLSQCRSFQLPVPPPAEQAEIVRRINALFIYADQLDAQVALSRSHIEAASPSLLAKAFRGELVPQDPNDEPAAALLARIAAQGDHAGASLQPRQRRKATPIGHRE